MRQILLVMTLSILIGSGSAAFAQAGSSAASKNSAKPAVQAPVGHRQPRAGAVPNEKNQSEPNNLVSDEDAALDRELRSICRGC